MPAKLANPEELWERPTSTQVVTREELERCLGAPVDEPWTVLAGGLANTNVKIGDKVVRIYRRTPRAAALEAALLKRGWRTFRVPELLAAGDGSLVLEYVAHRALTGSPEHGAAVGRALAEVHTSLRFDESGELDASLFVREPFGELVAALLTYLRRELEVTALAPALRERTREAIERVAPTLRDVAGPPVLLHADFKVSNLHWATDNRLLILDWEFAYAGSALSDIGQLLRWSPPSGFIGAFAHAYRAGGGMLLEGWERWAAAFDVVNLVGLLANQRSAGASARIADVSRRLEITLAMLGA